MSIMTNYNYLKSIGTWGSIVGWGAMLQAEKSPIWIAMSSLDCFSLTNPASHTMGPEVYSESNENEYQESSWG
jgi:hypothetical protein